MSTLNLQSTVTLSSGAKLPIIGFGALNQGDTKTALLEALKAGYRQIDGAQMYENEEECGAAVRESGVPREQLFITSKILSEHQGRETVLKGVDDSLKKWGIEYFDLFLLHDPLSGKESRLESYKSLLEAKKTGKVKTVGVSNFGVKHLQEIKDAGLELPAVNQIEIHPYLQQRDIAAFSKENSIVVQAYCPLIRGAANPVFTEIAEKYKKDVAQVLIRWSLQKGYVPLPKSGTPSRIQSNTQVFNFSLSDEDIAKLDTLEQGKPCSWNPVDAA